MANNRESWATHWTTQARILRSVAERYVRQPEWAARYERMAEAAERMAVREREGVTA